MPALIFLLVLVPFAAMAQTVSKHINDTGIDFCRDDSTGTNTPVTPTTTCTPAEGGQDARYGRDPAAQRGALSKVGGGSKGFDFTKIANDGSTLPASATLGSGPTDWACTYDNHTGLMWEVKTTSGLRSQSHTYTWYDSVHNYGGNPGTSSGGSCATAGRCDTEKFVADLNATNLCGHNDWRMPTIHELSNLADFGIAAPGPAIDAGYFPNTPASSFWSGSPHSNDWGQIARLVRFHNGSDLWDYVSSALHVRLVRAGQ